MVDLPQLRDDLFGLMLLLRHSGILQGSKAYFTEDHFSGGRPGPFQTLATFPFGKLTVWFRRL